MLVVGFYHWVEDGILSHPDILYAPGPGNLDSDLAVDARLDLPIL